MCRSCGYSFVNRKERVFVFRKRRTRSIPKFEGRGKECVCKNVFVSGSQETRRVKRQKGRKDGYETKKMSLSMCAMKRQEREFAVKCFHFISICK